MQLNGNTLVPYPCLNLNISEGDELPNIDFEIIHRNLSETTFRVRTKVDNNDILNLIHDGKAKYCLEMDCRNAFYRDAKLNKIGDFNVTLINNRFNGKLVATLSVVAINDIHNYKNSAFDSFYDSFTINIGPGEPLAYLGTFEMTMEEKSLEVKSIADDFIEVVCDDTLKYSRFDLGGSKILLKLPTAMYEKYHNPRISENMECESFLHASFLLNVLTSALQNIATYKDNKWAVSLHNRIVTEDELREIAIVGADGDMFEEDGSLINSDVALDLAQAILANPYERMFESFDNLNNREDD